MKPLGLALLAACLALAVAACGGGGGAKSAGPVPSVPAEAEPPAAPPAAEQPDSAGAAADEGHTFELWFVRDTPDGPRLFPTTRTVAELASTATAAGVPAEVVFYGTHPLVIQPYSMGNGHEWVLYEALRAGPSPDEAAAGLTSAIPAEAKAPGVCCGGGRPSTHDFASEFESGASSLELRLRLAQYVFTMTQPGGAETLGLAVDGQPVDVLSSDGTVLDRPVSRADFADLLPPITVTAPTIGSEVATPVRIGGSADGYASPVEVEARVLDASGNVLATVTPAAAIRSDYSIQIPVEISQRQPGVIQLEGRDAGGSSIGLVEIPVTLVPAGAASEPEGTLASWWLTRAEYRAQAGRICRAATDRLHDLQAGDDAGATLAAPLETVARWHENAASVAEEALANLRALPPPEADFTRANEFYWHAQQLIDVARRVAGAAKLAAASDVGDTTEVAYLIDQRVDRTRKLDASSWLPPGCPVALPT
jgi:hypothetical protein